MKLDWRGVTYKSNANNKARFKKIASQFKMDKVINLGIPHVAEQIFESFDTPGLIKCMEVSETWRELAGNVLIKRRNGEKYMQIFEAFKRGKTKSAYEFMWSLGTDELFQCTLVSETWKVLAENVLIKKLKGKMCLACATGKTKFVQLLLERCTSEESGLNITDELGRTPFMWACYNGHKDVVKLFLEHSDRIELNIKDGYGKTPFMWACFYGHKDVVQLFLEHSEIIDLNARENTGWTAFLNACYFGRKDVVKLLLKYSELVDINIPEDFHFPEEIKNMLAMHSNQK